MKSEIMEHNCGTKLLLADCEVLNIYGSLMNNEGAKFCEIKWSLMHFECQLQEHMLSSKNRQPSAQFTLFVWVTHRLQQKHLVMERKWVT